MVNPEIFYVECRESNTVAKGVLQSEHVGTLAAGSANIRHINYDHIATFVQSWS